MVDLASLRISVDSRDVKKAEGDLASMSNTAGSTSAAVDRLSAANNRLAQAVASSHKPTIDAVKYINQLQYEVESVGKSALQLKALEIRMAAARAPTAELAREIRNLGAELIKTERATARSGGGPNGIPAIGKSSGLATHHVQNLTFQLQDMFVGLASGQKPMTVFMQQGTQIGGIMQQAGMGVGGFTKEVIKMGAAAAAALLLNPAFLAVAAAAGVAYVAFQDFNDEVKKSGELDKFVAGLGLTKEELKKLGPVSVSAMDVIKGVWQTISEGLGLDKVFSSIGGFFKDLFRGVAGTAADLAAGLYGLFVGTYRGIVATWNMLPAAFADLTISAVNYSIRALEGLVNKSINLINGMIERVNKVAAAVKLPTIGLLGQVDIPELQNNYAGVAKKVGATFANEIANAVKGARGAMSAAGTTLGNNIIGQAKKRIGAEAKELIDERTAKKSGEKAGKSFAEKFLDEITKTMGDLNSLSMAMGREFAQNFGKDSAAEIKNMLDEIEAKRAGEATLREMELEREMKIATDGADLIAKTIGGSIGNSVNKLMNVFKKDFPDFARKLGTSFDSIKGGFDRILGGFGTSLKTVAGGFAVGGAVGGIVGGSATGGAIGGAFGSALGETFKSLGKFGGPLGAIAGGILGSVVGGLFKKTKSASATISAAAGKLDVAGIVGNNAQFKQTANTLADAIIGGLNNAAKALGAEISNAINISIGQRKNKFILDLQGLGRTTGAGTLSFETEAEAINYAIDKALRENILTGIRSGTQRLLQGIGDIETRLQKAVDFESVFSTMRQTLDPLGYSLEQLDKRFQSLRQTFNEAGATAEEYATLEQYYQLERVKAIDTANAANDNMTKAMELANQKRELEITLMELQGDASGALALRRQQELAAMDGSLVSLQKMIYAQQDLAAEQERLAAARSDEKSAIADLQAAVAQLDAGVAAAEAKLQEAIRAQRQRDIEAMRAQIQQLDSVIAARATAQQALRRAYDAEIARIDTEISMREENIKSLQSAYSEQAKTFDETIERFRDFALTLREFASTIVPMNGTGPASLESLRRRFADVMKAALGGDTAAMGQVTGIGTQLRESIIANATDRVSMLRQLYALQAETTAFANLADEQASIEERQLSTLKAQHDLLVSAEKNAIDNYNVQKNLLTQQVEQFIALNEQVLSVDEAIRQLQTAESAAIEAERQKAQLQSQIDYLQSLDTTILSIDEAQKELADAQARRDELLRLAVINGFENLIRATTRSANEMGRQAIEQITEAQKVTEPTKQLPNQVSSLGPNATLAQYEAALATAKTAAEARAINPGTVYFDIDAATAARIGDMSLVGTVMSIQELQRAVNNATPKFANGGMHSGGLRLVGENGPELETTGPSRIYNANQLGSMMGGGATAEEVKALRDELKLAMYQIAKNTGKSYDLLNRWDGDGLPPERIVA